MLTKKLEGLKSKTTVHDPVAKRKETTRQKLKIKGEGRKPRWLLCAPEGAYPAKTESKRKANEEASVECRARSSSVPAIHIGKGRSQKEGQPSKEEKGVGLPALQVTVLSGSLEKKRGPS